MELGVAYAREERGVVAHRGCWTGAVPFCSLPAMLGPRGGTQCVSCSPPPSLLPPYATHIARRLVPEQPADQRCGQRHSPLPAGAHARLCARRKGARASEKARRMGWGVEDVLGLAAAALARLAAPLLCASLLSIPAMHMHGAGPRVEDATATPPRHACAHTRTQLPTHTPRLTALPSTGPEDVQVAGQRGGPARGH